MEKPKKKKVFAMVLGSGGPLGAAWEAGLIAGLVEEEPRIIRAD